MKANAFVMILKRDGEIEILPLVLCKDCKYYEDGGKKCSHWLPCQEMSRPRDWFCASGEAMEEEENDV